MTWNSPFNYLCCSIVICLGLTACSTTSQQVTLQEFLKTKTHVSTQKTGNVLHLSVPSAQLTTEHHIVFIEGDGAQWKKNGTIPPKDPTPKHSSILGLIDASPNTTITSTYVARPCQYPTLISDPECDVRRWTVNRYDNQQIQTILDAVARVIRQRPSSNLHIVGHSGGGVISVRVAYQLIQKKIDVANVVALATPIDPDSWTKNHNYEQLVLDDYYRELRILKDKTCLTIWLGANDKLIRPTDISVSNSQMLGSRIRMVQDVDHTSGWIETWTNMILPTILGPRENCTEL